MGTADDAGVEDGRLPARLGAALDPELRDALDHPVRREVLRMLGRSERGQSLPQLCVELRPLRHSRVNYHLQVLRRSGSVAADVSAAGSEPAPPHYSSSVRDDVTVRAVLRATERRDREEREAAAAASASPLLTMFRVPRPLVTIRLRSRGRVDAERGR